MIVGISWDAVAEMKSAFAINDISFVVIGFSRCCGIVNQIRNSRSNVEDRKSQNTNNGFGVVARFGDGGAVIVDKLHHCKPSLGY